MQEIERKFKVVSTGFKDDSHDKYTIKQGFLNTHPERTVRVRITGSKAFLTIKGKSTQDGLSRFEWEKEIDVDEAQQLLALCEPGMIVKDRYLVKNGNFTFEIDEFHGDNEGLIIAEIELENETDSFEKPDWLGAEVTGETRFYNSQLSKNPFINWSESNDG